MRRLVFLIMGLCLASSAFGQSGNLAIHVTQAEVTMWRSWIRNGPASKQTQWNQIVNYASQTVEARWSGNTSGACPIPAGDVPSRTRDRTLTTAGFVWIVTKGTTDIVPNPTVYRDKVINALLSQAAVSGTNFANGSLWCVNTSIASEQHEVATWVRRIAYAYSYVRADMSAGNRSTLDAWFLDAGQYFDGGIHHIASQRFSGRLSDNYTCDTAQFCPGSSNGLTHFGGPTARSFGQPWSNTYATFAAAGAAVGIIVDDATLKANAIRWFQEWIKYAVFPGGQIFDQHRWNANPTVPVRGYFYPGTNLGTTITIADHFARAGNTSLYDYSTSIGYSPAGTTDGSTQKSLLKVMLNFAGKTNNTITEYASTTATTNADLKIDQVAGIPPESHARIDFVNLTPANVYYQLSSTPTAGEKTALNNAVHAAFPSGFECGSYDCRMGDWGTYPEIQFMFLDSTVDPYMGQMATPAPFVERCFAGRPEPNRIFIPVTVPSGLPLSGSSGCTARYGGVATTVNTVAAGTLFSGQPGITLTMADNIASGTVIDVSCGAGIADSDDNALIPVTNFACVNWFTQIFSEEWATAFTTGDDGRPFSELSDSDSAAETDSWVVTCGPPPCTMQATYNLRAPVTASNLLVIGDDTNQKQCETVTLESDATCAGAWTTEVDAQDCNAREQFQYPLADVVAQCWRLTFADNRGGASTGAQAFWANLTVAPDSPPPPPEQTVRRLRMMGGVLGLQGLRFR